MLIFDVSCQQKKENSQYLKNIAFTPIIFHAHGSIASLLFFFFYEYRTHRKRNKDFRMTVKKLNSGAMVTAVAPDVVADGLAAATEKASGIGWD